MELNVFTWFLRKTNITWIFQKLNFSTNLWYRIFCASNYACLMNYVGDSGGILTDHPTGCYSISGITVIHWGCDSTSSSHDSRKSVRLTSNLCHTKNYGEFTSIFIMLYKNHYNFSLDILNSYRRNWLLCDTLHQREPLISILSHCLFHSELEFVFWYSQGFGMCFEMVARRFDPVLNSWKWRIRDFRAWFSKIYI